MTHVARRAKITKISVPINVLGGDGPSYYSRANVTGDPDSERETAFRLRMVIDNAPIVLWALDKDGVFTLSEGRGLRGLGLSPGQVVGQSSFTIYASVPEIIDCIRRGLAGEEILKTLEVAGRVYETLYAPLRDPANGAVVGLLGISTDITERHAAEKERKTLQAQLLQVQKLESLGLLAGGIAHDFNNILTAILGGAATARLSLPQESPAQADLEIVINAAQRAADLTRQLLAYSGKGHFEVRPLDASRLVKELANLLETTIAKKVQLRLELASDLPSIEADLAQVQQIIMNLVINGAEAIGDQRGTVLVTTGVQTVDDVYAQSLFATDGITTGRYVFIEVHDTGCGMDEATKAKIFDPFFTTKFTGRGLGLAAVLGIVRGHGGAIKVYSSPGRGSTFKVFFRASSAEALERVKPVPRYRGEGLVLVVDDDAGVRGAARRMLKFFGFDVIEAEDGKVGAAAFAARASEIVLVLLDMTMPEMGGEETFREIRRVRDDVPVILTSGYNEIEATRRFTSKGLAGFLQKPFTPDDLATKLAAAFARDV
ncbi:MAG TPA: response regulator [Polyangia bacterium]|nr:response regulator [Polyangia bacterium]